MEQSLLSPPELLNFSMAFKANILKKFRRWLRRGETRRVLPLRDSLSVQVGKLLSTRGSELITMTTL